MPCAGWSEIYFDVYDDFIGKKLTKLESANQAQSVLPNLPQLQ